MFKLLVSLVLLGSTLCVETNVNVDSELKAQVAFTSYTAMLDSPVEVIKNELVRNTSDEPDLKNCVFLRDYIAKYSFDNDEHPHIWYFVYQCLNEDMTELNSYVTFNYNGDPSSVNTHELPEGCVPPTVSEPPANPCKNGFEIGEKLSRDVAKLVTKKIVHHPLAEINPDGEVDSNKLDVMVAKIPELESKLEELIETNHATDLEDIVPELITNENGEITQVYLFPSGTSIVVVTKPNGDTIRTNKYADGTSTEINVDDDGKTIIETYKDKNGNFNGSRTITEYNPDKSKEKVVERDANRVKISSIIRMKRKYNEKVSDVNVPDYVEDLFQNAAEEFAEILTSYVEAKIKCFSENTIDVKEDYLTFVCSTTGHDSIADALKAEYADSTLCAGGYCDELENELMDKMLHAANTGGDVENVSVASDKAIATNLVTVE